MPGAFKVQPMGGKGLKFCLEGVGRLGGGGGLYLFKTLYAGPENDGSKSTTVYYVLFV
jgi:hypothetical protein